MSIHRRLALRIINELMPAGNASNLRLTICKLLHAGDNCATQVSATTKTQHFAADAPPPTVDVTAPPCERVFTAVVRATLSAFTIGCAGNKNACDLFVKQLNLAGLDTHEQQMLLRELHNPTPPRGIAKLELSEEACVVVFLLTAFIVIRNGQLNPLYLRELAESLDINSLLAERLTQTAKQSVNEYPVNLAAHRVPTETDLLLA